MRMSGCIKIQHLSYHTITLVRTFAFKATAALAALVWLALSVNGATGQNQQQYTTPVPILKQINRQNEDGSYSFGYEAADKTFKIETKYPNGEVYGKYGYVDDSGKVREVEYGASQRGFEPAGTFVEYIDAVSDGLEACNNIAT